MQAANPCRPTLSMLGGCNLFRASSTAHKRGVRGGAVAERLLRKFAEAGGPATASANGQGRAPLEGFPASAKAGVSCNFASRLKDLEAVFADEKDQVEDRKSTRLNSSH